MRAECVESLRAPFEGSVFLNRGSEFDTSTSIFFVLFVVFVLLAFSLISSSESHRLTNSFLLNIGATSTRLLLGDELARLLLGSWFTGALLGDWFDDVELDFGDIGASTRLLLCDGRLLLGN
jgi:hypothetical protein